MLTSSGYPAISSAVPAKVFQTAKSYGGRAKTEKTTNKYDSLTVSGLPDKESRFRMELVGRMTQEVRAATTTGDIASLRQQVSAGQYQPDPMSMAARILFLGEG